VLLRCFGAEANVRFDAASFHFIRPAVRNSSRGSFVARDNVKSPYLCYSPYVKASPICLDAICRTELHPPVSLRDRAERSVAMVARSKRASSAVAPKVATKVVVALTLGQ
jgi:hypothetical protein